MRSDSGPGDAPQPAPGPPAESNGSGILWQRGTDEPATSMVFPREQQNIMPDNQTQGDLGQVGPLRRHVSRSSALLDNVAPAGVPFPQRPPSRQPHVNGSSSQGRAGAASGIFTKPDEDPWRASRQGLSSSESSGTDSPAQWIALHDTSQVSYIKLCSTLHTVLRCVSTEACKSAGCLNIELIQSCHLSSRAS